MAVRWKENTPLKKIFSDLHVKETTIGGWRSEMYGSYLEDISMFVKWVDCPNFLEISLNDKIFFCTYFKVSENGKHNSEAIGHSVIKHTLNLLNEAQNVFSASPLIIWISV